MEKNIWLEEEERLKEIIELINTRIKKSEESFSDQEHFIIGFKEGQRGTQFNRQALMSLYATEIYQLKLLLSSPYFGRMDFKNGDKTQQIYVGKKALVGDNGELLSYDWRSPVSAMYYDCSLGPAKYTYLGEEVNGELLSKRQIAIKNGELISVNEQDTLTDDSMLLQYLNAMADSRLKSIVATIQKEQNTIIRNPLNKNYIVQGVAGSGKTTVALHRIAYLIYNEAKKISESQFMILGPNEYFLNYISELLPDLDITNVTQSTFETLALGVLDKKIKVIDKNITLEKVLKNEVSQDIIHYKSSKEYLELIKKCVDSYISSHITNSIRYDDITLYQASSLQNNIFEKTPRFMNYTEKINILSKKIKTRIKNNHEDISYNVLLKYRKELSTLDNNDLKRSEIIEKMKKINKEITSGCPTIIKEYFKFVNVKPLVFYQSLVESLTQDMLPDNINVEELKEYTLSSIKNNQINHDDLAPLLYIKYMLSGINQYQDYKHLVIDEAQDLSDNQYYILKLMFPNCVFDIFGDLNQSIYDYQSIENWDSLLNTLFTTNTELLYLNKGYRTTKQISEASNYVLKEVNGKLAECIARNGNDIEINKTENNYLENLISQILKLLEKEYQTIAIICKDETRTDQLYQQLHKNKLNIHKISNADSTYNGGLCIMPAALSKGLEFDAVIIDEANQKNYCEESRLDMKLLYVAMTRALHSLNINYSDKLTRPLQLLQIDKHREKIKALEFPRKK